MFKLDGLILVIVFFAAHFYESSLMCQDLFEILLESALVLIVFVKMKDLAEVLLCDVKTAWSFLDRLLLRPLIYALVIHVDTVVISGLSHVIKHLH